MLQRRSLRLPKGTYIRPPNSRYLVPVAQRECGLEGRNVVVQETALFDLIKFWCRESGVRNLKQQIEKIFRKAALKLVRMIGPEVIAKEGEAAAASKDLPEAVVDTLNNPAIEITSDNLSEYVGSPPFAKERMYDITPPGVVMGLAWTAMGMTVSCHSYLQVDRFFIWSLF